MEVVMPLQRHGCLLELQRLCGPRHRAMVPHVEAPPLARLVVLGGAGWRGGAALELPQLLLAVSHHPRGVDDATGDGEVGRGVGAWAVAAVKLLLVRERLLGHLVVKALLALLLGPQPALPWACVLGARGTTPRPDGLQAGSLSLAEADLLLGRRGCGKLHRLLARVLAEMRCKLLLSPQRPRGLRPRLAAPDVADCFRGDGEDLGDEGRFPGNLAGEVRQGGVLVPHGVDLGGMLL
mmetsp:Transcript_41128/g.100903  ORF Transcript_41128/g.100903 Transcript_41128/m.100903 type:complete len:237 (-) Transcript_41128:194-904(-)